MIETVFVLHTEVPATWIFPVDPQIYASWMPVSSLVKKAIGEYPATPGLLDEELQRLRKMSRDERLRWALHQLRASGRVFEIFSSDAQGQVEFLKRAQFYDVENRAVEVLDNHREIFG